MADGVAAGTGARTAARGREAARRVLRDAGIGLALLAMVLFFAVAAKDFTTPGNIANILTQITINLILATGMTFAILVGGIDGSGVDDLNQTGSLGFPSSLGASYMESYMQSRPLSVRRAAAEKAGLGEEDTTALINAGARPDDEEDNVDMDIDMDSRGVGTHGRPFSEDEDMGIIGSMEGV